MTLRGLPYLAALVLAVAFLWSAIGKWRDVPATARAFRALGVPRPYRAARVVPGVEASLAGLLVVAPAGGAGLSLALLVGFTVFLARKLQAGVTAPCHCFGSGDGPLSRADLLRNGWLIAAALLALVAAWPQAPSPLAVVVAAAAAAVAALSVRAVRAALGRPPLPR